MHAREVRAVHLGKRKGAATTTTNNNNMSPRKGSVSATGGRMLNPSVEPAARRESAQAQLDTEGKARRDSAARSSGHVNNPSPSGSSSNLLDGGDSTASAAALEARNQRRTIGLKVRQPLLYPLMHCVVFSFVWYTLIVPHGQQEQLFSSSGGCCLFSRTIQGSHSAIEEPQRYTLL